MDLSHLPSDIALSRVLTTAEAAEYCGLDVQMFRRFHHEGKLPRPLKFSERKQGWRIGDLKAWIDSKAAEADDA